VLLRPAGSEQVQGHAFAIPAGDDRIEIEVLNATARKGLARSATRVLRRQGLDVVFLGNTPEGDRTRVTRVLVRRGDAEVGERVRKALGVGRVAVQLDTLRRVDVSVHLGDDYQPPPELHP
jgi:hypothetical protein